MAEAHYKVSKKLVQLVQVRKLNSHQKLLFEHRSNHLIHPQRHRATLASQRAKPKTLFDNQSLLAPENLLAHKKELCQLLYLEPMDNRHLDNKQFLLKHMITPYNLNLTEVDNHLQHCKGQSSFQQKFLCEHHKPVNNGIYCLYQMVDF
jgi:hypothetical protein